MKSLLIFFLIGLCFSQEIKIANKEISLIEIEKPTYDGTSGYSVFKVRENIKKMNIKKDLGTFLIEGQVSIIIDNSKEIFLISKKQFGNKMVIRDIFKLNLKNNEFSQILRNKIFNKYSVDKNKITFISPTDTVMVAITN